MVLYSVLLATYNERQNLPIIVALLVEQFERDCLDWELVIVDDSSPDGTFEVAKQLSTLFPPGRFKLLSRKEKSGLASAYAYASKHASGEFVIVMDADLSHHPKYIGQMVRLQRKHSYDIVTGTRYAHGQGDLSGVVGWSMRRKLTSTVANTMAAWLLGLPASGPQDLTGSFRLYRKSLFDVLLHDCVTSGYTFQMECIARAIKCGYSIGEVPIVFVDRVFGESKLCGKEIVNFLRGLYALLIELP